MIRYELKIPFILAWKSLRRGNKWTLALIIFLMAIAFINMVFIASLFNGIIENSNQQIIDTYTGHIYLSPPQGSDAIEKTETVLSRIRENQHVIGASAEMIVPGTLEYNNIKGNWQILAINPEDEKQVINVANKMIEGSNLSDDDTDQIIIGRQIAGGDKVEDNAFSFKGAHAGEKVTLKFGNDSKTFTIKGIFYTKFINTDERAFITQKAYQQINPQYANEATSIVVRIDKTGNEQQVIDALKQQNLNVTYLTWKDAAGLMASVTDSFLSINVIMSTVAVLIAAVTIFIVIYIDISSKRQQIGILRAIGIRPWIIRCAYIFQTGVYAILGVGLGTAIFFAAIVPYFMAHPFVLPIADATLAIDPADFIIRLETIIWVAIISGFIPTFFITRIKILDAIWGK